MTGRLCDSCGAAGPLTTEHWRLITDPGPTRHLVPAEDLTAVHLCARCKDDPYAEGNAATRSCIFQAGRQK